MQSEGIILKGIGGFYYVETSSGVFECKAKGRFRKEKITPVSGDKVIITVRENGENTIDEILPRKNFLIRPPVANIDSLMIVISVAQPYPNPLVIDKMTVLAEKNGIRPIIVVTKTDLEDETEILKAYSTTPYDVYTVSVNDKSNLDAIKEQLKGKLTALTGNSGVGKSTLLNALDSSLNLQTAEISEKLGRGRHTTRQAEIFHVSQGLVIDTAGFSFINFTDENLIFSDELQFYFAEFEEYIGQCKFTGCNHIGEKDCKICEMVKKGAISQSRYDSYISMFNEVKGYKKWNT